MRQIITRDELASLVVAAPRLAAFAASGLRAFTPPGNARSAIVALSVAMAVVVGATALPKAAVPAPDGFQVQDVLPLSGPEADRAAALSASVREAFTRMSLHAEEATDVEFDDRTTPGAFPVAAPPVRVQAQVPSAVGAVGRTAVTLPEQAQGQVSVPRRVLRAVLHAAERTGLDPAFLLSVAFTESRMATDAKNPLSSASGPFQFTRVGWFEAVYRFGSEHGLDRVASRISQDPSGAMVVDRSLRTRILALRDDPGPSAMMAAAAMKHDSLAVEAVTGRRAGLADMYLLHLLGTAGAVHFVSAATSGRHVRSDTVASAAVTNNPGIFVREGRILSAADAYAGIERMMSARVRVYDAMLSGHQGQAAPDIVEVASAPAPAPR